MSMNSCVYVRECVRGLTGCTARIVAFDQFLILVNLVRLNCSKLLCFYLLVCICIIMSMRMVADVETSEASDQKGHNEFVTTYDVEGTKTELEKAMATFDKPLSFVGALLAYSNALANFDNPKLGEDNCDPKPSCSGTCVSYTGIQHPTSSHQQYPPSFVVIYIHIKICSDIPQVSTEWRCQVLGHNEDTLS